MYACTLSLAGTKKMTNNLQDEQENLLSNVKLGFDTLCAFRDLCVLGIYRFLADFVNKCFLDFVRAHLYTETKTGRSSSEPA